MLRLFTLSISLLLLVPLEITRAPSASQLIKITEILKNPEGSEDTIPGGKSHEFIEFTNFGTEPFSLNHLLLSDGQKVDSIIHWPESLSQYSNCIFSTTLLLPGQSACILDPDYADAPVSSFFMIDSGTILLTVNHTSLIDGLSSNDGLFFYKGTRIRIDTIITFLADSEQTLILDGEKIQHTSPAGIPEGFSIVPSQILFFPHEYSQSPESLSLGHYEYQQNGWISEWIFGDINETASTVRCSVLFLKMGSPISPNATWSITTTQPVIQTIIPPTPLISTDNTAHSSCNLALDSVQYQLAVTENGETAFWDIDISPVWTPLSAIKITEIFPKANETPEWFEITNTSSMAINIKNWSVGNSEDSSSLPETNLIIQPGSYHVITKDAQSFNAFFPSTTNTIELDNWHTLDNYNDTLILWNNKGISIETACYHNKWFNKWEHQSLERITLDTPSCSRSSWAIATNPTPGQPNGSPTWRNVINTTMDIGPIPFTPDDDKIDDSLKIRIQLPSTARLSLSIYGFNGKKLYDFPSQSEKSCIWNGKRNDGTPAPVGPFFVVAEIKNNGNKDMIRKKGVLWRK